MAMVERIKTVMMGPGPDEPLGWRTGVLPPGSREKLEKIRLDIDEHQAVHQAHFEERETIRRELNTARMELANLDAFFRYNERAKQESREYQQATRAVERFRQDLARLEERSAERGSRRTALIALHARIESWLTRNAEFVLAPFTEPAPKIRRGEAPPVAIERCRRRLRDLQADLHRVRSAPIHSSRAKEIVRAQVEAMAASAKPDVFGTIERGEPARFPNLNGPSDAYEAAVANLGMEVPARPAGPFALAALLQPEALLAVLDREIDALADDKAALTDEARATAEAEILADMLAVEREEEAFVLMAEEAGLDVVRRPDADPRAVLELDGNLPPPPEA